MSKVEIQEGSFEKVTWYSIDCIECGSGWGSDSDRTTKEEFLKEFGDKIGTDSKCSCGTKLEYREEDVDRYNPPLHIVTCDCGTKLIATRFTNECKCGQYYNQWGQEILPPKYWEREWYDNESQEDCIGWD